jgi:hypothetical protein
MQEMIRSWCEPRLRPGTLAVLWCGPAARGFEDAGEDLDVRFVCEDQVLARDWDGGRQVVRDVAGGRVIAARGVAAAVLAREPWEPEQRFEYGRAKVIWDEDGRVEALLAERAAASPQVRERECLGVYVELRTLWQGLSHQLKRRDPDAVAVAAFQVAEAAMRLHFSLDGRGQPPRSWLLPEFRRHHPPLGWESAVHELLRRETGADVRRAAAHLVELGRDAIHAAFRISRGRLDAWDSLAPEVRG